MQSHNPFFSNSKMMKALLSMEENEIKQLQLAIEQVLEQFSVSTATSTIARWEKEVGLKPNLLGTTWDALQANEVTFDSVEGVSWDEIEKMYIPDLEERRSAVKARLRGYGTMTKGKVKEICGAYTGGTVGVIEYPSEHRIVIEFVDVRGIPSNMESLQSIINELMPAHLAVEFKFRYLRWNELDSYGWTWDTLDSMNLTWDEFEEVIQ